MEIVKNGKTFRIEEKNDKWAIKRDVDGVKVSYDIPKKDCSSLEDVKEYVNNNDIF